ncbi:MAG: DUF5107 domain-containing protein [Verrucomicrobiota bacterium]
MSSDKVKLYEETVSIREHNQLPLDPHPPYGNMTGYLCYPNQFYGSRQFQVDEREVKLLVAENEYLKIAMAPDYGGRLWYAYDKLKKREIFHRVNTEAKVYNAGMGLGYMGGGMELNLPNAHSHTNVRPRVCHGRENDDGSVSLVIENIEKIGRVQWTVSFTLRPGEARIEQKVRVANESTMEARYLYWANCGVPADGDTEFIYPEKSGAVHGNYENALSWPGYDKTNIALVKNLDEMLGLYMLDATEGYFGAYNHADKSGLLHYADVRDLPAKKTWTWGWHEDARHSGKTHSDDGKCYIEIQSGRVEIQEELERILPMTSNEWTEYWYPYSDIGIVNGVSADAAVNFSVEPKGGKEAVANIQLFANRNLENLKVVLFIGNEMLKEVPLPSLSLGKPEALSVALEADDCEAVALAVVDASNEAVVGALPEAIRKQTEDSYFSPDILLENKPEDFTAEGYFAKAESLMKDWFDHAPEIKRLFGESLKVDPGFSRAHIELGLLDLKGGRFEEALGHFNRSLQRIFDDGRTIYYKGLTLWLLGRADEARAVLRRAARFGYETQARVAEAMIAIHQDDFEDALAQLDRAELLGGDILLIKVLKTLVFQRGGRASDAAAALDAVAEITTDNAFVPCTRYLLSGNDEGLKAEVAQRYSGLQSEILEVVAVFNFAGLNEEAHALLGLIDASNDMVELYRTHLSRILGKDGGVVPAVGGVKDYAWRIEEFMLLRQAISLDPENADNYFHLGNFYYGRSFEEEGIAAWEQAVEKGCRSPVLSYQFFRALKRRGEMDKAKQYLKDAYAQDGNDPYIFDDYAEMVFEEEGNEAGIKFMEENVLLSGTCFTAVQRLMDAYLDVEAFGKLEKALAQVDMPDFWRPAFGKYWVTLKQAQGFVELRNGEYATALENFNESVRIPKSISTNYYVPLTQQARRLFYLGLCHSKLGDESAAKECWEECLGIKNTIKFENSFKFYICCARYYQAFALKAMNRHADAETNIALIKETAMNPKFPEDIKKALLNLGNMAGRCGCDEFESYDNPVGITTNLTMAASAED